MATSGNSDCYVKKPTDTYGQDQRLADAKASPTFFALSNTPEADVTLSLIQAPLNKSTKITPPGVGCCLEGKK